MFYLAAAVWIAYLALGATIKLRSGGRSTELEKQDAVAAVGCFLLPVWWVAALVGSIGMLLWGFEFIPVAVGFIGSVLLSGLYLFLAEFWGAEYWFTLAGRLARVRGAYTIAEPAVLSIAAVILVAGAFPPN